MFCSVQKLSRKKMKLGNIITAFIVQLLVLNSFGQGWVQKTNFGGMARGNAIGFSIGNLGYVGMGYDGPNYFNDLWEYDPSTDTWTQMASLPADQRYAPVGFSIGAKGYVGTGIDQMAKLYNDFWEYDPPPNNSWVQKTNFGGAARVHAVGFAIGDRGYLGTGVAGATYYNDFWEYDPTDLINGLDANGNPMGSWTQKANVGGNVRRSATAMAINGMGYIGMGMSPAYNNDFWEYDPSLDSWTQKATFGGSARIDAFGLSLAGRGYAGLGYSGAYHGDLWEYTPGAGVMGGTWLQLCNFLGTPRAGCTSVFTANGRGYVGTGNDGTGFQNDFWELQPACGGALPVELLAFSAKWQDETYSSAIIKWQTANEINVNYFEIERSIDGINFVSIAQTEGLNSNAITDYQKIDYDPYVEGPSYYRLRSVDIDGTFSYSQIEVLNVPEGLNFISLYPNPTIGQFSILLTASQADEVSIRIKNNLGQELRRLEGNVVIGFNSFHMDVSELSTGTYFIEVVTESGLYRIERKFVKSSQ